MRLLAVVLLVLFGYSFCIKKCPAFMVADATKRNWVSGAPGGKSGTAFSIKVILKTSKKIEFTGLWIGNKKVPFELQYYSPSSKIMNGDSLLLTYNYIFNQPENDSIANSLPFKYKGEALIEYLLNKKVCYYSVKRVRELSALQGE